MNSDGLYRFEAEVWEHQGTASWFFVSLPPEVADDIEGRFGGRAAGFGSIRVEVAVGGSRWSTSIFPDNARATYLLPVKKAVRKAEGLVDGSTTEVELSVSRV